VNVSFVHFHHIVHFYLMLVRHFLNHTFALVGIFWRPLSPSALGNSLVRLMLSPALLTALLLGDITLRIV